MEKQKYCKLGEGWEIKENNGRDHSLVIEGINYQQRIFYISRRLEHNVVNYARYYIFYRSFETSRSIVLKSKLISIERILQNINKQMLETNYTLNLR
jgi:hypothetical protein